MSGLTLQNVTKQFGTFTAVRNVQLTVPHGTFVCLLGPSGCGKTTLMRMVAGLDLPTSGEIRLDGADITHVPTHKRDLGMVFQSLALFPHLTVGENIMLAPRIVKDVAKSETKDIAREVLQLVGLSEKFDSYPDQLSGGQQQRVAIARSLAMRPKVMLFDEVTSALDPELTEEVLTVMENLAKDGMTMILVTHEMAFARRVATETIFMHKGKIWEQGRSSELFANPQTPELRQFVKADVK